MKKLNSIGILIIAALVFGFLILKRPFSPHLNCPALIDMGVCGRGMAADAPFTLSNDGGEELNVSNFRFDWPFLIVRTEDGTAVDQQTQLNIPPRASRTLTARFVMTEVSGDQMKAHAAFATNDPRQPQARIDFVGTIRGYLTATPTELSLTQLRANTTEKRLIELLDTGLAKSPRISRIVSSHPDIFQASLLPANSVKATADPRAKQVGQIEVSVPALKAPTDIAGEISVYVEDVPAPFLKLPVRIRVLPTIQISPSAIVLPRVVGGKPSLSAMAHCKHVDGLPVELSPLDVPAGLSVEIAKITGTAEQQVTIQWQRERENGLTGAHKRIVRLSASHGGNVETIEIPVTCISSE